MRMEKIDHHCIANKTIFTLGIATEFQPTVTSFKLN